MAVAPMERTELLGSEITLRWCVFGLFQEGSGGGSSQELKISYRHLLVVLNKYSLSHLLVATCRLQEWHTQHLSPTDLQVAMQWPLT